MELGTRSAIKLFALAALAALVLGTGPCTSVIVVNDGESIQDAVDAAPPGSTIVVKAGTYTAPGGANAVVEVQKDGITLLGNPKAVIDATGTRWGVLVGDINAGCLVTSVSDFTMRGFTVKNADRTAVYIANVNGYEVSGGRYLDNAEYGPYPVCSTNGIIRGNYAAGHEDAAIYVGQSDGCLIENNVVEDSIIGIEVENSANTVVRFNETKGNTAGIFVVVLPGLNIPASDHVLIERNNVYDNNRENLNVVGDLALLPEGTGILNVGGDDVVIRNNNVRFNDSFGIASIGNPFFLFDGRIERFVDGLEVRENLVLNNGSSPDPDRALAPGADIVFVADVINPFAGGSLIAPDPDPFDNCFDRNQYRTEFVQATVMPDATLADFPCN